MPDELPDWVVSDIENAEFTDTRKVDGTGVILELYGKDNKADVQLYEPVEDGRHIITMDVPAGSDTKTLEKGTVYCFVFEQHKAPLGKKTVEYLLNEKGIEMDAIYRFGLQSLEAVGADEAGGG